MSRKIPTLAEALKYGESLVGADECFADRCAIRLAQEVRRLQAELAALKAECERLREDKARLDALDQNARIRGRILAVMERGADHEPIRWAGIKWGGKDGQTVREAIDNRTKGTA